MIPLANSLDTYHAIQADLKNKQMPTNELQQLINTEAAIKAARSCRLDLLDPVKAELHLRHWHGLACQNEDGLQPGHFKYTQNRIPSNPAQRRVEPALASTTFRHFMSEIYSKQPPGYARAAVVYMAIVDLHLFTNGNVFGDIYNVPVSQ